MIYVTYRYCEFSEFRTINKVFYVNFDNVVELYKCFMIKKGEELGVTINPHWLNIMNYENHHKHITESDYNVKVKKWESTLKRWTIEKFIIKKMGGKELAFTEITGF